MKNTNHFSRAPYCRPSDSFKVYRVEETIISHKARSFAIFIMILDGNCASLIFSALFSFSQLVSRNFNSFPL